MKAKINRLQYFFLIPNLFFGKAIGITAGVIVRKIGADTWTSMLFGFIISAIFIWLMTYICSKFPDKTIVEYSQVLLGKWFGRVIGIILCMYFAVAYAVSANVIMLHLSEYLLPNTPFIILCIVYALLCAYGVILGIEVVIRFSLFGFFMLWAINITMILGTIKDFNFINLQPLLDRGLILNLRNSIYTFCDSAMPILTTGFIYSMLNNKKKTKTITLVAMLISAISVIIWPFFETGVMGADVMKQFVVVCMQQVRCAQLTRYLPRYELLMVSFFVWSVFVQSTTMLWCSIYSFKQATNIKKDWVIIAIFIPILIFLTNYLGHNHVYYIEFLAFPWTQISFYLSIGLPIILILAYFIRKK